MSHISSSYKWSVSESDAPCHSYAVFPERLEVISQSNLFKVVGRVAGEMVTIEGRLRDSGWALIMPETGETPGTPGSTSSGLTPTPLANMMRWVTGKSMVTRSNGEATLTHSPPQVSMTSSGYTVVLRDIAGIRKIQRVFSSRILRVTSEE